MHKFPIRAKCQIKIFPPPPGALPPAPGIYRLRDICVGGDRTRAGKEKRAVSRKKRPPRIVTRVGARVASQQEPYPPHGHRKLYNRAKNGIKNRASQLVKVYADLTRNGLRLLTF